MAPFAAPSKDGLATIQFADITAIEGFGKNQRDARLRRQKKVRAPKLKRQLQGSAKYTKTFSRTDVLSHDKTNSSLLLLPEIAAPQGITSPSPSPLRDTSVEKTHCRDAEVRVEVPPQRLSRRESKMKANHKKKNYRLSTRINSGFVNTNTFTTTNQVELPPIDFRELRKLNAETELFNREIGFFTDYIRQAKRKGINLKATGHV